MVEDVRNAIVLQITPAIISRDTMIMSVDTKTALCTPDVRSQKFRTFLIKKMKSIKSMLIL